MGQSHDQLFFSGIVRSHWYLIAVQKAPGPGLCSKDQGCGWKSQAAVAPLGRADGAGPGGGGCSYRLSLGKAGSQEQAFIHSPTRSSHHTVWNACCVAGTTAGARDKRQRLWSTLDCIQIPAPSLSQSFNLSVYLQPPLQTEDSGNAQLTELRWRIR